MLIFAVLGAYERSCRPMSVQEILNTKGTKVVTIEPSALVSVAARLLRLKNIGALVVSKDGASIDGIISERDIVYGLIDHGADVLNKPVSELMTGHPFTCTPQMGVKEAMRLMSVKRIRHLPVMKEGRLSGIISIGDVMKNRLDELELEGHVLHDYIVAHQ
jgi:CBS domain-containing protein